MVKIQARIAPFLNYLDTVLDRLKPRHAGRTRLHIHPYRGFGTDKKIFIIGRVLEGPLIRLSKKDNGLWNRLMNNMMYFESDEIPYALLKIRYAGVEATIQADEEGYYQSWLDIPSGYQEEQPVMSVALELLQPLRPDKQPVRVEQQVSIVKPGVSFAIFSDIDDTVVQTDVTRPLWNIWNLLFKSARTRGSFPGTAAFFQGLWDNARNPVFYVSSGPWNLYDLIIEFLKYQQFPPDPIVYLRDWGITDTEFLPTDHYQHKMKVFTTILDLYPELKFILIGDSGQQDPEIYIKTAESYPGRIMAIYLREVTGDLERIDTIHRLRARLGRAGIPVVLTESVLPMAEHAAAHGWISSESLKSVRASFHAS